MIAALATSGWLAGSVGAWRRFRAALDDPRSAQEAVLRRIVDQGRTSAFGRDHGLDRVTDPATFARAVPLRTWDELAPWVDRAVAGEPDVLTTSPISRFEPTSGSTSGRKLIPSTSAGRAELRRAVGAWVVETYRRDPRLIGGPAYWSISPTLPPERTPGGHAVGFDDDAGYLGGVTARLVRRALVAPTPGLDGERFWRATAEAVLRAGDLRLISIWSPSFGELLLDAVERHWDAILPNLSRSRRRFLEGSGPGRAWPNLRLLSVWGDAGAAGELPRLVARLPGVAVQPKGLLATEGVVTIPFADAHPLALTAHWLEFEPDQGEPIPLWSARDDEEGCVVLTTGHGLWRYRLRDRVRVVGRVGRTPSLRFLGRQDRVADQRGEKLSEPFVGRVLEGLGVAGFALLAPEERGYVLYAEARVDAGALESALAENPHYRWCVSLGQLAPVRVVRVGPEAGRRYLQAQEARGVRLGDVKVPRLETGSGWGPILG